MAAAGVMYVSIDGKRWRSRLPSSRCADRSRAPANMPLGADTLPFSAAVAAAQGQAAGSPATVPLGADPLPFQGTIASTVAGAAATVVTVTLDANADPATGKINGTVQLGNGETATMTLDANPDPATGKIKGTVVGANGEVGTITIDGNPDPATGQIRAVVQFGNGTPTTITINPRDLATPVINKLKEPTRSTHTIEVVAQRTPSTASLKGERYARGAIISAQRDGGVLGMAPGARLTPMPGGIAKIVPPNTWRVIGDRIRDDEAYIPMNQSRRSMDILATTAAQMGQSITPRRTARMATGAVARSGAAGPIDLTALSPGALNEPMARASAVISTAMSSLRMPAGADLGPVVAALSRIKASLPRGGQDGRGPTAGDVHVTVMIDGKEFHGMIDTRVDGREKSWRRALGAQ